MTARLERLIDDLQAEVTLPRSFILPGASPASAAMDVARTSVRRAEREVVRLKDAGGLANPEILKYSESGKRSTVHPGPLRRPGTCPWRS